MWLKPQVRLHNNWTEAIIKGNISKASKQLGSTAVIPADLKMLARAALLGVFPPEADTRICVSRPHLTQHVTDFTTPPPFPHKGVIVPRNAGQPLIPGLGRVCFPKPLTDQDNWLVLIPCDRVSFAREFNVALILHRSLTYMHHFWYRSLADHPLLIKSTNVYATVHF